MILPLLASVYIGITQPPYPIIKEDIIYTTWESQGEGIEYELQCSPKEDFSILYVRHNPTLQLYQGCRYHQDILNCRRLYYGSPGSIKTDYINLGCYYVDLPDPIEKLKEEEIPKDILIPSKDVKPTPPEVIDYRPELNSEILIPTQETVPDEKTEEDPQPDISLEVLGASDKNTNNNFCNLNFLNKRTIRYLDTDCNFQQQVKSINYFKTDSLYTLEANGIYTENIKANVNIYTCKSFDLFDIKTWFRCEKILDETSVKDLKINYIAYFTLNEQSISPDSFVFNNKDFYIRKIFTTDISKKNSKVKLKAYGDIKLQQWETFEQVLEIPIDIKLTQQNKNTKPFQYPLDKLIGVTQWHGCTKYQCPHKGIDFGAKNNNVIAIGDGVVTELAFDKYGGECNQGGRDIKIKHTNGMYSTYFHLESFKVKKGQSVNKGDLIGISGNSGKWNCQNLKHHLHFEIRKDVSSSTHVNPVEYIGVDWNSVYTLGVSSNPGRLSGDNPHPNF